MNSESDNSQLKYPKKYFRELSLPGKITVLLNYINIICLFPTMILFFSSFIINDRSFFLLTSFIFFATLLLIPSLMIISIWTAPGNILHMDGKNKKKNAEELIEILLILLGSIGLLYIPFIFGS